MFALIDTLDVKRVVIPYDNHRGMEEKAAVREMEVMADYLVETEGNLEVMLEV